MIEKNLYKKTVVDGLRIVSEKIPGFKSASIGAFLLTGVRDEDEENLGITHFIEHMIFKGTEKRSSYEISREIEDRGGIIDAFTAKEMMAVYSKVLGEDIEIAIDVIGDLFSNPLFKEEDIEKEKNVVIEEYKEFLDDPEEVLHSTLYESLFPSHPLSKEILGKEETIKSFTREKVLNYWEKIFFPENFLIIGVGDIEHEKFVEETLKNFKFKKERELIFKKEYPFKKPIPKLKIYPHLNQIQCIIAFRTFGFKDKRRYHLMVSNSVIGGNMSSRLFQKLREEKGLVYSVSSFVDFHRDAGIFGISFSTNPKNFEETIITLKEEIEILKEKGLEEKELERAKSFSLGHLAISLENTETRLIRLANLEIYLEKYLEVEEVINEIKNIKLEEINETLYQIVDKERMGISLCSPSEKYFDILNLIF